MSSSPVYFAIVFEDVLSEVVIERLLQLSPHKISIVRRIPGYGCGDIRSKITSFFSAAIHHQPFFVLMDSDKDDCAVHLLNSLVPGDKRNEMCIFRIAVREVEAWLLADHYGISRFLGINQSLISRNPEALEDPKNHLVHLAKKSGKKDIAKTIAPSPGTSAAIGPEYNQALLPFVRKNWDINQAAKRSESLRRAVEAITRFKP